MYAHANKMIHSPLIKPPRIECPVEGCHLYNSSSSSTLKEHLKIYHQWLVCPLSGCQDDFPLHFLRHHFSMKHSNMKCFVEGCSYSNISFAELATHVSDIHPYPFLFEVYHALFSHSYRVFFIESRKVICYKILKITLFHVGFGPRTEVTMGYLLSDQFKMHF